MKKILGANGTLMRYINAQIEKLDEKRKQLSSKLISLQQSSSAGEISDYISKWSEMTLEDKIEVMDALVKIVRVSSEEIEITWKI